MIFYVGVHDPHMAKHFPRVPGGGRSEAKQGPILPAFVPSCFSL